MKEYKRDELLGLVRDGQAIHLDRDDGDLIVFGNVQRIGFAQEDNHVTVGLVRSELTGRLYVITNPSLIHRWFWG